MAELQSVTFPRLAGVFMDESAPDLLLRVAEPSDNAQLLALVSVPMPSNGVMVGMAREPFDVGHGEDQMVQAFEMDHARSVTLRALPRCAGLGRWRCRIRRHGEGAQGPAAWRASASHMLRVRPSPAPS